MTAALSDFADRAIDEAVSAAITERVPGAEPQGIAVLALGKLGSRTARIGAAFGMEVIAWSQNLTEERAAEVGARRVDKDRLFASSDVLSIHLILGDRTRGLVGAADIARMKPGALLVNTSRGPIVDEAALIDGAFPQAVQTRLLTAVDAELRRLDLSGIDPPELRPGTIGPVARALGGASLPLFDRYLLDQHTLAGRGR